MRSRAPHRRGDDRRTRKFQPSTHEYFRDNVKSRIDEPALARQSRYHFRWMGRAVVPTRPLDEERKAYSANHRLEGRRR